MYPRRAILGRSGRAQPAPVTGAEPPAAGRAPRVTRVRVRMRVFRPRTERSPATAHEKPPEKGPIRRTQKEPGSRYQATAEPLNRARQTER